MVEAGQKKEAYPLIKKILERTPDDLEVKLAFANLAFELGKLETARKLLVGLAGPEGASLDVLQMTARVYERLGRNSSAAKYWLKILHNSVFCYFVRLDWKPSMKITVIWIVRILYLHLTR